MNKFKNFIVNNYLFIVFLYLTCFFLLRILTSGSFERDESAQYMLSGIFKWGYNTQPPLYTWIQSIFFKLFNNPFIALSLLKNILIFFIYYFTYKITYKLSCNKILSAISTSSLIFIPPFSWEFQRDLTHSVLVTFSAMLLLYFIVFIKNKHIVKIFDYILLGFFVAIGILSKYNFIMLLIVLFVISLFNKELKNIIINKKIIVSIVTSVVILSPHLYWILNNFDIATSGSIKKMHISDSYYNITVSLKVLFMALAELLAPYIILFILFFKNIDLKQEKLFKDYFTILIITLIIFVITFKIEYFKSRWVVPIFIPITIFMTLSIKNLNKNIAIRWIYLSVVIMFGFLISFSMRYFFPDLVSKKPSRFNYPTKKIYKYLRNNNIKYNNVLIADSLMGANLKYYNSNVKYYFINDKQFNNLYGNQKTLIIFDMDSVWLINWLNKKNINTKSVKIKYKNSNRYYVFYFATI